MEKKCFVKGCRANGKFKMAKERVGRNKDVDVCRTHLLEILRGASSNLVGVCVLAVNSLKVG